MGSWDSTVHYGIDWMDAQHHALLDELDRLEEALIQGSMGKALGSTVAFIQRYSQEHFGEEERRMTALAYPGRDVHLAQHATFCDMARRFASRLKGDTSQGKLILADDLSLDLRAWFIAHIQNVDRDLAAFLIQQKLE